MDHLPQELINRILDYLPSQDVKSMRLVHGCFRSYGLAKLLARLVCGVSSEEAIDYLDDISTEIEGGVVSAQSFEEMAKYESYRCLVKSIVFLDLEELIQEHDLQLNKFIGLKEITIRNTEYNLKMAQLRPKMCEAMSCLELERYESMYWFVFLLPEDFAVNDVITPGYKRFLSHLTSAKLMFEYYDTDGWSVPETLGNLEAFLTSFQRLSRLKLSVPVYIGRNGVSHRIFNALYAPNLHSLTLFFNSVAGSDLIHFLERHKSTLRNLVLMTVKLDDTKASSGPSFYAWGSVFKWIHDHLSLADFYMNTCLMEDHGGGICWVIPDTIEWCACLEAQEFGSDCLGELLIDYILRKGPPPTNYWSTAKPRIDRATLEDEEQGWLDDCKLKSPYSLGDCSFFGTKDKKYWRQ